MQEQIFFSCPSTEVCIKDQKSCTFCSSPIGNSTGSGIFFADLSKEHRYICFVCMRNSKLKKTSPYICVAEDQLKDKNLLDVKGIYMEYEKQLKLPFYGYTCCVCGGKNQAISAKLSCKECQEGKKTWCLDCFSEDNECVMKMHQVVLESHPFTFWIETLPEKEKNLSKFKKAYSNSMNTFNQGAAFAQAEDYIKAEKYYKEVFKRHTAREDVDTADLYRALGQTSIRMGRFKEGIDQLSECCRIKEVISKKPYIDLYDIYKRLGTAYKLSGDYKKAVELYEMAQDILEKNFKHEIIWAANLYQDVAEVFLIQGELPKAVELYEKSLKLKSESPIEYNGGITYSAFKGLGDTYRALGRYDTSRKNYEEALQSILSIYGEQSSEAATIYSELADVLMNLDLHQEALRHNEKAIRIYKSIFGERDHNMMICHSNTAELYMSSEKYEKAIIYYKMALKLAKRVYGRMHLNSFAYYYKIGVLLFRQGRYQDALKVF